jgi:hypothetical protein
MARKNGQAVVCRISVRFFRSITFHRITFNQLVERIKAIWYQVSPGLDNFSVPVLPVFLVTIQIAKNVKRSFSEAYLFVRRAEAA